MKGNYMELKFKAMSGNESFARTCVAAFCLSLNPTIDEINDIKTAVSEAVTNCVVHAYPTEIGDITLSAKISDTFLEIIVSDEGIGIKNIELAKEPFYTSKPKEERSGLGFTVMESFMDKMLVEKNGESGVKVTLIKKFLRGERLVKGVNCVRSM